jgi:hypothetical protein
MMDDGPIGVPPVLGDRLSQGTDVPRVDAAPSEASPTASTAPDTMKGMLRPKLTGGMSILLRQRVGRVGRA